MKLYKATVYAVGSPKKITVYVEANDYNQAIFLIKANPSFRRWGQKPHAYKPRTEEKDGPRIVRFEIEE